MKNYTDLSIICDRSGSMGGIAKDMEGGIKAFLDVENSKEDKTVVSYYRFDTEYEVVFENKDSKEHPPIAIPARGGTALLDAIGRTMQAKGQQYAAMKEEDRPNRVLFMIITDGEENSSQEYTFDKIKEMIKHQRDVYSWDFMFMGTTEDALFQREGLGIAVNASKGFARNKKSITEAFYSASLGYQDYKKLDRSNVQTRAMSYCFANDNSADAADDDAQAAFLSTAASLPVTK